jgi:hypothetical protein
MVPAILTPSSMKVDSQSELTSDLSATLPRISCRAETERDSRPWLDRNAPKENPPPRNNATLPPQSLSENKPAASAITSSRDDELTERRHGYQNYFFSLWTGPKSRTTVEVRNSTRQCRLRDCPAWRMHRCAPPVHAPSTRKSISARRRDDLGVANSNVTPEVTDHACPQHSRTPPGACGEQKSPVSTFGIGADRTRISCRCCWSERTACDFPRRKSQETTPRDLYRAT